MADLIREQAATATVDLYACPHCRQLDYRPLGDGRRLCLACGKSYRTSADTVEVLNGRSSTQLQRQSCPACGDYAYSPGPAGLLQRRCHGCGEVWGP